MKIPRKECAVCGFTKGLETHHVDWNHDNNHILNLETLCKYCHMQANKLGKPLFEQMIERVKFNPDYLAELRKSAEEFYREHSGH